MTAVAEAASNVHLMGVEGGSDDLDVEVREVTVELGDRLLLCSDGVFAVLTDDEIRTELGREVALDDLCHTLIRAVNNGGGPDNVTAVVLKVDAV